MPLTNTGRRAASANATSARSACAQYTSPPANSTGRSDAATSFATAWTAAGSGAAPRDGAGVDRRDVDAARTEHIERDVDECRTAMRCLRGSARGVELGDDRLGGRCGRRALHDGRDDRHMIELLQRTVAPTLLRRPAADHDHRRSVHAGRGHGTHTVGDAGSRGERRAPEPPRHLGPALGRERRGLLVTGVDEPQVGLHRAVVEHEEVPARQREHHVDTVRAQDLDGEPAAVGVHGQLPVATSAPRKPCRAANHASGASNWGE